MSRSFNSFVFTLKAAGATPADTDHMVDLMVEIKDRTETTITTPADMTTRTTEAGTIRAAMIQDRVRYSHKFQPKTFH